MTKSRFVETDGNPFVTVKEAPKEPEQPTNQGE